MKYPCLAVLLLPALAVAHGDRRQQINVNSRYTVEAVEVSGVPDTKVSRPLRDDLQRMVGDKFDQERLDDLLRRLRGEFPGRPIFHKLRRGLKQDHVKVLVVVAHRQVEFKFAGRNPHYHSKQGWSADAELTIPVTRNNALSFGVVSNADDLLERFAGLTAGFERKSLGTDKARLKFRFESSHNIWNRTSLLALERSPDVPGIYRTRQNFEPTLTLLPVRGLTLGLGASFQRFQTQFPAARTEAANALVTSLRYDRQLEDSVANRHRLEAGYTLRAATRTLSSDFVYASHTTRFNYKFVRGRNVVDNRFSAGLISGRAPLFERFTLGNTATLRGWSKFDVAPLGGNRMAHNSLEYRYRVLKVFYDTGAVWNRAKSAGVKHSAGIGLWHHGFLIALAFPIKDGRAEPVFMAGLSF